MSATEAQLRKQIADHEAKLESLRAKLAKITAPKGERPPTTGLDLLWKEALPICRNRSTKHQCRTEWNKIPKAERPTLQETIDALKAWNRSDEWKKDGNAYVPALHRWIKNRGWESIPASGAVRSRHVSPTPKPLPEPVDPNDLVTDRAELKALLSLDPIQNDQAEQPKG
jgi:hypothetical protein